MYFHIPVLLEETIRELKIKKGGIYYDLTFGGGGHTKNILEKQMIILLKMIYPKIQLEL